MKKLPKLGQKVKLLERRIEYACGYDTPDRRAYVPVGTEGTVGTERVPSVRGKNGVARYFCCVDFPCETPLEDYKGNKINHSNPHKNKYRVAAYPEEIELVK